MEAVEQARPDELDRLIERRAQGRDGRDAANERAALLAQSVERYNAKQHQAELWERARFHRRQLANHRATFREIVRRHKAGLAECERALGITDETTKGTAA